MQRIIGLDIGGANTKICILGHQDGKVLGAIGDSVCYEVWKNPQGLRKILVNFRDFLTQGKNVPINGIALTMTAELCDVFSTKAQGVTFIVQMVQDAFSDIPLYIWTTKGAFKSPGEIRNNPLEAAAANWLASAAALAQSPFLGKEAVILGDMGSTTTDILPLMSNNVLVKGRTDSERLLSGELVYTGLLRTPIDAIVDHVYLNGVYCPVVKEYFAVSGDVYRLLGLISEDDYHVPTPDGGKRDSAGCAQRLARMVSAEIEDLGMEKICLMARYIQEKQIGQIMESISRIVSRRELPLPQLLITTGQGSFILEEAARRMAWKTVPWWKMIPGARPEYVMTAYAVAWVLLNKQGK
ncbi:MAG: hydantoinase/oxoprolinase family protein [Dehalobacterium sp.]